MKRESTANEIIGDDILLYLKDDIVDLSKYEHPIGVHGTVMAIEGEGIYVNGANGNSWLSWYQDGIGTSLSRRYTNHGTGATWASTGTLTAYTQMKFFANWNAANGFVGYVRNMKIWKTE